MQIDILTLFPEVFSSIFSASIIKRAQDQKIVNLRTLNIRNWGEGKHKKVDDKSYGGGVGMILRVDILDKAIGFAKKTVQAKTCRIILLDPKGKQFTQNHARNLSQYDHLILVCGHYEGVDERIKKFVDESISIGPYVLTGGEIPAMVISETVIRLLPGVLIKPKALEEESFSEDQLEYPQYTIPQEYKGHSVPKVLLGGNYAQIQNWRAERKKRLRSLKIEKKD